MQHKEKKEKLEKVLKNLNFKECPISLVIVCESGRNEGNIHVVINLRFKV